MHPGLKWSPESWASPFTSEVLRGNSGTSTARLLSTTLLPPQIRTLRVSLHSPLALPPCRSRLPLLLPSAMLATPSANSPQSARLRAPSHSASPHARFRLDVLRDTPSPK